jgi:hypothetical protein
VRCRRGRNPSPSRTKAFRKFAGQNLPWHFVVHFRFD